MDDVKCSTCPVCGASPYIPLLGTWPEQAWCSNEDCDVLVWDATQTLAENLTHARNVDDLRNEK